MSRDFLILKEIESSFEPATLVRFYRWTSPTVSIGRNQDAESALDYKYCIDHKISIVHRPTGGRAVLHANELTYAVISNDTNLFGNSVQAGYAKIGQALKAGFDGIGIECILAKGVKETATSFREGSKKPCFVTPTRSELLYQNRKIAGSAQRRLKKAFLQHGSIPLEIDYTEMGKVLSYSPSDLKKNMVSVSGAAGRPVSFHELEFALEKGFRSVLNPS